jgi:aldose 1-epimerase
MPPPGGSVYRSVAAGRTEPHDRGARSTEGGPHLQLIVRPVQYFREFTCRGQQMTGIEPFQDIPLESANGRIVATAMGLGATIRDLKVRRSDGTLQRVVLGLARAEDYPAHSPHMGAIAGRFANRIAGGRFMLDGAQYQLPRNENGRTALHGGGLTGLGKSPWAVLHRDKASVVFAHHSLDGHNGYPGALTVTCRITLAPPAILRLELWAMTDAATVINLCHHSYFNLDGSPDVLGQKQEGHKLMVRANLFAPVDTDHVPNGMLAAVAGTPLDFRRLRALAGIDRQPLDTTYILRRKRTEPSTAKALALAHAATLVAPRTSLALECWTTEPALQVYDGHKLAVAVPGLDGATYGPCAGIALEPQHVPDSPNLPHFPSTVLRPGLLYRQVTEYRFRDAAPAEVRDG